MNGPPSPSLRRELPKRKTDPQSQAGRLALQGVRRRGVEKEEALRAEEGEDEVVLSGECRI